METFASVLLGRSGITTVATVLLFASLGFRKMEHGDDIERQTCMIAYRNRNTIYGFKTVHGNSSECK